jgi:hypothetical protein
MPAPHPGENRYSGSGGNIQVCLSLNGYGKREQIRRFNEILIEPSSPLLGYINWVEGGFEFIKSLEIQD